MVNPVLKIYCFAHSFARADWAWGLSRKRRPEPACAQNGAHKLSPQRHSNSIHPHDYRVFREHGDQAVHLGTVGLDRAGNASDLAGGFLHKHLCHRTFWNQCNDRFGKFIHFHSIALLEEVAMEFAPFLVAFRKCV